MTSPFYNAIKGTTSGTPGTGAFTPNAAATGFRAWSTVPTGWIGMVRFDDGTNWELTWCYWNGTTLSRSSSQLYDSSSGSAISLTSSATASMIIDASDVMSHIGTTKVGGWMAQAGSGTMTAIGIPAPTNLGSSNSGGVLATTNYLTTAVRTQSMSATTANAQAGHHIAAGATVAISSSTAGQGGWEQTVRFGSSQLPTGPRLFIGLSSVNYAGNTGEPSALTANLAAFAKDSTDTNIQLLVNSNAGGGTKTDTCIPLVANSCYESCIWTEPGSTKIYGLLIRLDTGDIWFGSTTTDVPVNGATMMPCVIGCLSATTGTAIILCCGSMVIRTGA